MQYLLLMLNIILMSSGQLFFKKAGSFFEGNKDMSFVQKFLYNPWFYAAIILYAGTTFLWVKILSTMKVSIAYPIMSISYILVAIGAYYFFEEKINIYIAIGIALIIAGVFFLNLK